MIKQANLIPDEGVIEEVMKVVKSGKYINGEYNQIFSKLWAQECDTQFCVPCSSGSAALISCLKFFKKKNQDNYCVIPDYSFAATLFAILEADYIPIFCGVDSSGLMIEEQLLKILGQFEVSAIIPVHLYGQYLKLNVEQIRGVTGAAIIEDACQVHGNFALQGDAAAFSFYPSKNLGALGNAGAIVTNNNKLREFANRYINYGDDLGEKYAHHIQGNNLRMDEIQAAALVAKYKYLEDNNLKRSYNASHYINAQIYSLATLNSNYHLYPVLFENRAKARIMFKEAQIEVGDHYPYTLNELYHKPDYSYKTFPYWQQNSADMLANHVLTLPIGPHLTSAELEKVSIFIHQNFKWVTDGGERGMFACR